MSWNAIIDAYMKIRDTQKAFYAFEEVPDKSIVRTSGYARNGRGVEAVRFFRDMIRNGLQPISFSLGACYLLATFGQGIMVHCSFRIGFHTAAYVGNGLVNMYARCRDIEGSNEAFHDILVKDVVSWNTILLAYGMNGWASKALQVQVQEEC